MGIVYRKSLKGIDELASKSGALSLRLTSYLLAVDGASSADELAARNPHLPSMEVVLNGLMQQGFVEPVSGMAAALLPATPATPPAPAMPPAGTAPPRPRPRNGAADSIWPNTLPPPEFSNTLPPPGAHDLEFTKADMVRDVSGLLGSDAAPVIAKIQNCRTVDELFATMMGIKKIVSMYVDKRAAEQFAQRYERLSS